MPIGDFENQLVDEDVAELMVTIGDYSSAWWDMRTASQMMHVHNQLRSDPSEAFTRRAILDGAVMAYSRCFESGRRRANIQSLVDALEPAMAELAAAVDRWRDHHVAHRVNRDWEAVEITLVWPDFKQSGPAVRSRVFTQIKPDLEGFDQRFEELALHLADRIWEVHLWPQALTLLDRLGAEKLAALREQAEPYTSTMPLVDRFGVTADLGGEMAVNIDPSGTAV